MGCCYRLFFIVLLTVSSILSIGSDMEMHNMKIQKCYVDEDCNNGFYCFDSGLCTMCTDCTEYHRETGHQMCVKDPQDCGVCFTGFEPKLLTNNGTKYYCTKSLTTSTPPLPSVNSSYYDIFIPIFVGVFIIIVISIYCFKKMALCKKLKYIKKLIQKDRSEESNNNNYCHIITKNNESTVIYQPEESRNLCDNFSNTNDFSSKEEEQNVQAGIFCRPYYDHHLTPTMANQPTIAHEPQTIHTPSAPPPYSPRSSNEQPITPVQDSTRNPESTASSDTVNSNSTPEENLDQNNLRVPSRQSSSMDAHKQNNVRGPLRQSSSMEAQERWWSNFPHLQIINKVLVSNVNDNSSKNMQNQINETVADNKKAQNYKSILQNDE